MGQTASSVLRTAEFTMQNSALPGLPKLTYRFFNYIAASRKLPFIFNNIVALICRLLFLNSLLSAPRRCFGWFWQPPFVGERRIALRLSRPHVPVLEME